MHSARIFLVSDDAQSACYARLDCDVDRVAIRHSLLGGGLLWETHGCKDGSLVDAESIVSNPATVIACYPKRVAERYPGIDVVFPGHDDVVYVQYVDITVNVTAVVVHTGFSEGDPLVESTQRKIDELRREYA